MTFLLDTHLLLWAAGSPERLTLETRQLLNGQGVILAFSVVSIWEVVIKSALGRSDFRADARQLRDGLLANGYQELEIRSEHALAVGQLPPIHQDPFDRILIAQAQVEEFTLLTTDGDVSRYPGPIRTV
ncbi:MAG: type II toxin-antitoxin system VapC family toxin [Chloroflexota bacterium]|nr:type II toxin-antitoxin system VapC family toxin [Chloroflexota bacterium]